MALLGGTFGTAVREGLTLTFTSTGDIPYAIFAVNVLGAFLLGLLLDSLARMGPDEGRRRRMRIMVGTGFMGGFTTYSALAADTAGLLGGGRVGVGIAYGLGTVLVGGLATWAGIATATVLHGRSRAVARRRTLDAPRSGDSR
nr:CrcB family protein [Brevibacterium marinum]